MAQLLNLTAKTGERGDTSYRIRYCSVFWDTNRLAVPSSRISYYISCAKLLVVPTYNIANLMDVEESINILTGLAEIEQYFAEIASAKEKQAEREARAELKGMAREINYRYWNRPLDIEVIYSDDLPKYTLGRCGSDSVGWG